MTNRILQPTASFLCLSDTPKLAKKTKTKRAMKQEDEWKWKNAHKKKSVPEHNQ